MPGNSIGQLFVVTTFGESHGPAYGCIIDGCPPHLHLSESDIQIELDRRKPGQSQFTSQRREPDQIKILSGVFAGKTTGTPIGLMIENNDAHPKDYAQLENVFRPGHADYTYQKKYSIRDHRGGGRASARETTMRVAAGAIAKKYLRENYQLEIYGYLKQIGDIQLDKKNLAIVNNNPFFCADEEKIIAIENYINNLRREKNSVGARINLEIHNVPAGLGEPIFDRLNAGLAKAIFSIPAVKGFEIGDGFNVVTQKGHEHRDALSPQGFISNHAGGILGGISSGQNILLSVALKPTSSIPQPIQTITKQNTETEITVTGRHDPCIGFRAVPVIEAMCAIVLMDHLLRQRAQNSFDQPR